VIVFGCLGLGRRFQVHTIVHTTSAQYFTGSPDSASAVLVLSKIVHIEHSAILFC